MSLFSFETMRRVWPPRALPPPAVCAGGKDNDYRTTIIVIVALATDAHNGDIEGDGAVVDWRPLSFFFVNSPKLPRHGVGRRIAEKGRRYRARSGVGIGSDCDPVQEAGLEFGITILQDVPEPLTSGMVCSQRLKRAGVGGAALALKKNQVFWHLASTVEEPRQLITIKRKQQWRGDHLVKAQQHFLEPGVGERVLYAAFQTLVHWRADCRGQF